MERRDPYPTQQMSSLRIDSRVSKASDRVQGRNTSTNDLHTSNSSRVFHHGVDEALKQLSTFYGSLSNFKCPKCRQRALSKFDLEKHIYSWSTTARQKHATNHQGSSLSLVSCASCRTTACCGCGRSQDCTSQSVKTGDYHISWCCDQGRIASVWMLLCWADDQAQKQQEEELQNSKGKQRAIYGPHGLNATEMGYPRSSFFMDPQKKKKGTGYGGDDFWELDMGPTRSMLFSMERFGSPAAAAQARDPGRKLDNRNEDVFKILTAHLPNAKAPKATKFDQAPPRVLNALFVLSSTLDVLATVVRNDSVDDAVKRRGVYLASLELIERLSMHQGLRSLVTEPRHSKRASAGLYAISMDGGRSSLSLADPKEGQASSILSNLESLGIQSRTIVGASTKMSHEFRDSQAREQLAMCKRIDDLLERLPSSKGSNKQSTSNAGFVNSAMQRWSEYWEQHRVEVVSDEHVVPNMLVHQRWRNPFEGHPRSGRMRQLVKEVASMMTSLPEGIFLRVGESRPDHIRAAIIGPAGTPYFGGIFEFDILCGLSYPQRPPSVMWRYQPGVVAMNPNLHNDGEVCLSLLGTWEGVSTENWQPGVSTLYQVLVSIQSFIFNDNPAENEPGFSDSFLHARVIEQDYKRWAQVGTVVGYMLPWLRERQRDRLIQNRWGELIRKHFAAHAEEILSTVRHWSYDNPMLRRSTTMTYERFGRLSGVSDRIPEGVDLVAVLERELKPFLGARH